MMEYMHIAANSHVTYRLHWIEYWCLTRLAERLQAILLCALLHARGCVTLFDPMCAVLLHHALPRPNTTTAIREVQHVN